MLRGAKEMKELNFVRTIKPCFGSDYEEWKAKDNEGNIIALVRRTYFKDKENYYYLYSPQVTTFWNGFNSPEEAMNFTNQKDWQFIRNENTEVVR